MYFIPTPETCDICGEALPKEVGGKMYDAKTSIGPWGCMCQGCFDREGGTLGQGYGQQYERRHDGKFHKIAG